MTRETKIGLLVGLAFIIVIGILLEEHLSSTTEPQQAAVGGAGANVRDSVTTPAGADGSNANGSNNDGSPVTVAGGADGRADGARRLVTTREDLRAASPPVTVARQGRGSPAAPAPVSPAPISPVPPTAAGIAEGSSGPGSASPSGSAPLIPNPVDPPAGRLPRGTRELLLQHPDDLTAVDPARAGSTPPRPYTAVPGDSLSHMAARLLGANTRANRELLIRANPSLQAEGHPVIAGRTYLVPAVAKSPAVAPPAPAALASAPDGGGARSARAGAYQWYTVKGNDNLWKIAESQLGNGNAWTTIRDMNKDVLQNGETVHPNMRLRLPARSAVAGAD